MSSLNINLNIGEQLLLYQSKASKIVENDVKFHRYAYSETDDLVHDIIQSPNSGLIYTSDDVINIDVSGDCHIILRSEKRINMNNKHRDLQPITNVSVRYEWDTLPVGIFPVGGPSIRTRSSLIPLKWAVDDTIFSGASFSWEQHSDDEAQPTFGFTIPVDGQGIVSFSHNLVVADTSNEVVILDVKPVFYNRINVGRFAGFFVMLGLPTGRNNVFIGRSDTDDVHDGHIDLKGITTAMNHTPYDVTLDIQVTGSITCKTLHIAGTNLPEIQSNKILTDEDYTVIKNAIDTLLANDVALAEALDTVGNQLYNTLTAISSDINDIYSKLYDSGFSAHNIIQSVSKVLTFASALIPNVVIKQGLNAMATILSFGLSAFGFFSSSQKRPDGPTSKILAISTGLVSLVNKMKYVKIQQSVFKDTINQLFSDINAGNYKYVEYVQYAVNLSLYESGFENLINLVAGIPIEKLYPLNLYPVHTFVQVREVVNHTSTHVPRNLHLSVSDGVLNGSITNVGVISGDNFVHYTTWSGDSTNTPESVTNEIRGREAVELQRGVAKCDFETVVQVANYLVKEVAPYNLLFNNCHSTSGLFIEFLENGNLPTRFKGDDIFASV